MTLSTACLESSSDVNKVTGDEFKIIINEMVKYHQLKTSVRSNLARKPNKHPEPKPGNLEKIKQQIREEVRDEFQNKNYQSDRRGEVNLKKKHPQVSQFIS